VTFSTQNRQEAQPQLFKSLPWASAIHAAKKSTELLRYERERAALNTRYQRFSW